MTIQGQLRSSTWSMVMTPSFPSTTYRVVAVVRMAACLLLVIHQSHCFAPRSSFSSSSSLRTLPVAGQLPSAPSFFSSRTSLWGRMTSRLQMSSPWGSGDSASPETLALEALQSLADFHEGEWKGQAISFSVQPDVAAGIVHRHRSPEYHAHVKLGLSSASATGTATTSASSPAVSVTETVQWDAPTTASRSSSSTHISSQVIALHTAQADVDSVDGSYSWDGSLPQLPIAAVTQVPTLPYFAMEHTLALSNHRRARCWLLYGMDQALLRVIVAQEERLEQQQDKSISNAEQDRKDDLDNDKALTALDLLEMQSDVDRIVDTVTNSMAANNKNGNSDTARNRGANNNNLPTRNKATEVWSSGRTGGSSNPAEATATEGEQPPLTPHRATLLELSSGVWLGDIIVRDQAGQAPPQSRGGKGFGGAKRRNSSSPKRVPSSKNTNKSGRFGQWTLGVQKAAWRWMWNFGEEIRQVVDFGRPLGVGFAGTSSEPTRDGGSRSMPGMVCVNGEADFMARRRRRQRRRRMASIFDDDDGDDDDDDDLARMVYIDWSTSERVSFLIDNLAVQAPRYLTFGNNPPHRPDAELFATEFAAFQSSPSGENQLQDVGLLTPTLAAETSLNVELPEVVCSKIGRVYTPEGQLQQGFTSFFTLKRFGSEMEEGGEKSWQ